MAFSIKIKDKVYLFQVVFQPIIDVSDGRTVGMEVLSREYSGENIELILSEVAGKGGMQVFTSALVKEVTRVRSNLPEGIKFLSINLCLDDLCDSHILHQLCKFFDDLTDTGVQLVLEIPENEPFPCCDTREGARLNLNISSLKAKGVLIAIDDFGKGFNQCDSLVYRVMPDILKIDKRIVQMPKKYKKTWRKIEIAQQRLCGLKVVAEGVENLRDLAFVMGKGIELCQGFYFGRPKACVNMPK